MSSSAADFDEISVLIPGYAAEDLPSDLAEEPASSLLNAVAISWHPALIARSRGIPVLRHADSIRQFTGRHVALIPTASEDFLPADWQQDQSLQFHLVLHSCHDRQQWLDALNSALPSVPEESAGSAPVLVDQFLAFGTTWLMVLMLSRRRHHFVDPDETTLVREIHLAAESSLRADIAATTLHLGNCFNLLLETRERFYPLSCCLLDLCLPPADTPLPELITAIRETPQLSLVASVSELVAWSRSSPEFRETLLDRVRIGELCLMTGHQSEVRSSLGSLAALLHDLDAGLRSLSAEFQLAPEHWSRRRFGLLSSLPMILHHLGYKSAFHVALDDGLYPDRERTQFDWQAPDGSTIPATSRIPLAVDSSAAMLRFPDRYNESMQDDSNASLLLARLPETRTPWLRDLRIAASFAPVLGEFTTLDGLTRRCAGSRHRLRFEHGEYLSPGLIQSAVLKTESPVSGPAALHQFWMRTASLTVLQAVLAMIRPAQVSPDLAVRLRQIGDQLLELEQLHCEIPSDPDEHHSRQSRFAAGLTDQLQCLQSECSRLLLAAVPHATCHARGLLIFNPLPFRRDVLLPWNASWTRPAADAAIQALAPATDASLLCVRLPPCGFVWLSESDDTSRHPPQPWLQTARREPPLAEELILRNQHFEVQLSEVTGGISSVVFYKSRENRLSQQVSFRLEHEFQQTSDDGMKTTTSYARPRLVGSRIVHSGPLLGELESTIEILAPADDSVLASCRQWTSVDRYSPRIEIRLVFDSIRDAVTGHPWLTYFACRFAWENENSSITRSVLGQAADFRGERFETPDYFEVADESHRFAVCTHGMPYHRRTSRHTIDSLLICENEAAREFRLTIDFDQSVPIRCAAAAQSPPVILETAGLRPAGASSAWLLGVIPKNIMLVSATADPGTISTETPTPADNQDPPQNPLRLRLILCETEGQPVDATVRTARRPVAAWRKSLDDSISQPLQVHEDGVTVHCDRFQLTEIELIF